VSRLMCNTVKDLICVIFITVIEFICIVLVSMLMLGSGLYANVGL